MNGSGVGEVFPLSLCADVKPKISQRLQLSFEDICYETCWLSQDIANISAGGGVRGVSPVPSVLLCANMAENLFLCKQASGWATILLSIICIFN